MYEAIVGKMSVATCRIYCPQRHFAPNWHFISLDSQNGCGRSWEIGGRHATYAQRDVLPGNWNNDVCMIACWNANEFGAKPFLIIVMGYMLRHPNHAFRLRGGVLSGGFHWIMALARSLSEKWRSDKIRWPPRRVCIREGGNMKMKVSLGDRKGERGGALESSSADVIEKSE